MMHMRYLNRTCFHKAELKRVILSYSPQGALAPLPQDESCGLSCSLLPGPAFPWRMETIRQQAAAGLGPNRTGSVINP